MICAVGADVLIRPVYRAAGRGDRICRGGYHPPAGRHMGRSLRDAMNVKPRRARALPLPACGWRPHPSDEICRPGETVEKAVARIDTGRKIVTKETQEGCLSFLIIRFWNFSKVSKSSSACQKDFFDKLTGALSHRQRPGGSAVYNMDPIFVLQVIQHAFQTADGNLHTL